MEMKIVKWSDFNEVIKTPFMTSKSRDLAKHACAGNVKGYADVLAGYKFPGTRDFTMVSNFMTIPALAKNTTNPKIKELLKDIKIREMDYAFRCIGLGDGKALKTYINAGHLNEYGDIFVYVLTEYGSMSEEEAYKKWEEFVERLGKMKKWRLNKKLVYKLFVPFVRGTMLLQLAEAFEEGLRDEDAIRNAEKTIPVGGVKVLPEGEVDKRKRKKKPLPIIPGVVSDDLIENIKSEAPKWRSQKGTWTVNFDELVKKGNNGAEPQPVVGKNGAKDWTPVIRAFERGFVAEVGKFKNVNSRKDWVSKVFNFYKSKFKKGCPFTEEMYNFMKNSGIQVENYYR